MTVAAERDLDEGRRRRDEGMARVQENAATWSQAVWPLLLRIVARLDEPFTAEEVNLEIRHVAPEPHHPNAWGALTNTAVRRGVYLKIDRTAPMTRPRSHARATPLYRRGVFAVPPEASFW